jgi:hypothetical protein
MEIDINSLTPAEILELWTVLTEEEKTKAIIRLYGNTQKDESE